MPSTVRLATPDDHLALLDLLRMKHDEDGIGAFDARKANLSVERGISRFRSMIGVVRGDDGLEASIGLFMHAPWDSSDERLIDRWLFVHPEHRRSEHAKGMLQFAKWAATELECPLVMSTMVTEATANKAALYGRQLSKAAGAVFVFMPPCFGPGTAAKV